MKTQGRGALEGKTIAVLATDGFEESELVEPKERLAREGARIVVVSPKEGSIQGYRHRDPGAQVKVDEPLARADASRFDALVLPGGVANPDELRTDAAAVEFVRAFVAAGKPVAAICHAPWLLVEAEAVEGRRVTSWPSVRTDLENAGARWVDEPVVTDGGLVTSRKPDDVPAFVAALVELVAGRVRKDPKRAAEAEAPPSTP